MLPSLFIAHGSPMLAVENNSYTQYLSQLGSSMPKPDAVVLLSAHWTTGVQMVSDTQKYGTIHDFGGFPPALYQIQYPACGQHDVAQRVQRLLQDHGVPYQVDSQRGLDHGAWVILRLLYPSADVPVVAMSVTPRSTPEDQYRVGKALGELRAHNILVIGSGGTVHNLAAVNFHDDERVDDWAVAFDDWLQAQLTEWDLDSLFNYRKMAPGVHMAVPPSGNEHFIPLFYAMGAADDSPAAQLLYRGYLYGNLSHTVWQFG